jgi:hypothetical protein
MPQVFATLRCPVPPLRLGQPPATVERAGPGRRAQSARAVKPQHIQGPDAPLSITHEKPKESSAEQLPLKAVQSQQSALVSLCDEPLSLKPPPGCWPGSSRKPRTLRQRLGGGIENVSREKLEETCFALIEEFMQDFGLTRLPAYQDWEKVKGFRTELKKVERLELEAEPPVQLQWSSIEERVKNWRLLERKMGMFASKLRMKRESNTEMIETELARLREEVESNILQLNQPAAGNQMCQRRLQVLAERQAQLNERLLHKHQLHHKLEELAEDMRRLELDVEQREKDLDQCRRYKDYCERHKVQDVLASVDEYQGRYVKPMLELETEADELKREVLRLERAIRDGGTKAETLRQQLEFWQAKVDSGIVERSESLTPRPELTSEMDEQLGIKDCETEFSTKEIFTGIDSRLRKIQHMTKMVQVDLNAEKKRCAELLENASVVCPFPMAALSTMGAKLEFMFKSPTPGPVLMRIIPCWTERAVWSYAHAVWMELVRVLPPSVQGQPSLLTKELIDQARLQFDRSLESNGSNAEGTVFEGLTYIGERTTLDAAPKPFVFHQVLTRRAPVSLLTIHNDAMEQLMTYLRTADSARNKCLPVGLAELCLRQLSQDLMLSSVGTELIASAPAESILLDFSLQWRDENSPLQPISSEIMRQLYRQQESLFVGIRQLLIEKAWNMSAPSRMQRGRFSTISAVTTDTVSAGGLSTSSTSFLSTDSTWWTFAITHQGLVDALEGGKYLSRRAVFVDKLSSASDGSTASLNDLGAMRIHTNNFAKHVSTVVRKAFVGNLLRGTGANVPAAALINREQEKLFLPPALPADIFPLVQEQRNFLSKLDMPHNYFQQNASSTTNSGAAPSTLGPEDIVYDLSEVLVLLRQLPLRQYLQVVN